MAEPGGSDNGSQRAFLGGYARALIPAMLMDGRDGELREVAALMGGPSVPDLLLSGINPYRNTSSFRDAQ